MINSLAGSKLAAIVLALFIVHGSAAAGYAGPVKVSTIRGIGDTYVYVRFSVQPAGTCDNWSEYVRFDASTAQGAQLLSGLLVAYSSDRQLDIWYEPSSTPGTDETNGCSQTTMATLTKIRLK